MERVDGGDNGNVEGSWQKAWPLDFPKGLKLGCPIHSGCLHQGIIDISHGRNIENNRLTNGGCQEDNDDGQEGPLLVPQPGNILLNDPARFQDIVEDS